MTTREQLEYAAKAMGYTGFKDASDIWSYRVDQVEGYWNPLTDQADSDRMACKLRISTLLHTNNVYCYSGARGSGMIEHDTTDEDVCRAVREARMQVAVEIGRAM